MRFVLYAVAVLVIAVAAHADPVTYTYTGQYFTVASGAYTTSDRITGSFTVNSTFTGNYSGTFVPTAFVFTDGVQTLTSLNAASSSFQLSTDAQGGFTSYNISIDTAQHGGIDIIDLSTGQFDEGGFGNVSYAYVTKTGVFTRSGVPASVTPEPSGFVLLGTAVTGMGAILRKRLA